MQMQTAATRTKTSPTGQEFPVRARRKVRLGPVCLEICSNETQFRGMRYFPQSVEAAENDAPDYSVNLCNLGLDGPWSTQTILRLQDRGYRANRFAMGYYLTDHFGAPAYLVTRQADHWIFSSDFEPILWPYLIKYLLTIHSLRHAMLHVKAASLAVRGAGTLLVARGGGGKTLLLSQLCRSGGQFLSNTHTLLEGDIIVPVKTALRVRADAIFGHIIATRRLPPAIKPGEYTADPVSDLGWDAGTKVPVRNVCLVDYQPGKRVIRELDRDVLFDYMDQFALALNVYGLKEDILDFLGGDVAAFSAHTHAMRIRLRELIDGCRTYYISCDCTDPANLRQIHERLAPCGHDRSG